MPNLFDRLGKPQPAETNTVNELTQKPLPAQELLDWLLGYWPKPTIRASILPSQPDSFQRARLDGVGRLG